MTVGNSGNVGELSGYEPDNIVGGGDYVYNIGTFEVTAGQYTEFLNTMAAEDTYELYEELMAYPFTDGVWGCNIRRSGLPGRYSYSIASDWADRPVNYVSCGDAARFTNWLHNGQPTGAQDLTTTEGGSYHLNGATTENFSIGFRVGEVSESGCNFECDGDGDVDLYDFALYQASFADTRCFALFPMVFNGPQ